MAELPLVGGRIREALGRLSATLSSVRLRRIALLAGLSYALLYLFSLGLIVITPGNSVIPGDDRLIFVGLDGLWRERAPYNYEPMLLVEPFDGFALFIALPNYLLAALLGLLLGFNISTLVYSYQRAKACGLGHSLGGVLASVPAFLTGFACCTPTVIILLGAAFAASFVALLQWFMPAALGALGLALVWNLTRSLPTPAVDSRE